MKIHVVKGHRGKFVLRWSDSNGSLRQRTLDLEARPANRKKAYQLAADLEAELNGQTPPKILLSKRDPKRIKYSPVEAAENNDRLDGSWDSYKIHMVKTHLAALSPGYSNVILPIIGRFEEFSKIEKLRDITTHRVRLWLASLREEGLSPSTIKSYRGHLSAFLSLAVDEGLLSSLPRVKLPKIGKKMKGRPLTSDEIEGMKKAAKALRPKDGAQWEWNIEALITSGLRISEAYKITWEPSEFYVDLDRKNPCFVIAGAQKNGEHQKLPLVEDFLQLLRRVSKAKRTGRIFSFPGRTKTGDLAFAQVKNVFAMIGEEAGIETEPGKTATAHDLRRTFGNRWAMYAKPQLLKALMRHKDIQTTMSYYVDLDADDAADELRHMTKHMTKRRKKKKPQKGDN